MLCMTIVHSDMHTRDQFLNLHVCLDLDFVLYLFRFSIFHAFVRLVSSVPCQDIGWEERYRMTYSVKCDMKP